VKKYYDKVNDRLVFVQGRADSEYWDEHWSCVSRNDLVAQIKVRNRFVLGQTEKYLPKGSVVLEGGCGRGQNVWTLQQAGYDCWGADFAAETVEMVHEVMPDLKVSVTDVRNLSFESDFFDGYWSLGVIEHFFGGYSEIRDEMRRVLRRHGILFLTAPSMSLLRRVKAELGRYEPFLKERFSQDAFYQFALSDERIITDFTASGFKLLAHKKISGLKGLKDEVSLVRKPLQKLYDSRSRTSQAIHKALDVSFRNLTNHMSYFVLQKC
jgi:SAM-dependent methyltransferase